MCRVILILLVQLSFIQIFSQETHSFHPPLKIPLILSGNFGEIRSDHFHSGIDIKTRGTTGHEVYSIESGFVSRIKVQANGYGKAIYLNHPTGHTSVYGHLDRYREDIAGYVRKMQYRNRTHEIDLYLEPDRFRVEKGELIAYSGNTGGSSGPHLHFEIRTAANQHPTNVLLHPFSVADRVAPVFHSIRIYPLGPEGSVNGRRDKFRTIVARSGGSYTIPGTEELIASGPVGMSVEVFDYLDGASNRCGVYSLALYLDDRLIYRHLMDEFSFSETRYINAHIDYEELVTSGIKAHSLHRKPNDRLRIYRELEDDGVIRLQEGDRSRVRIVATDVAGNQSELRFRISGASPALPHPDQDMAAEGLMMRYDRENHFTDQEISISIPSHALYEDLLFTFSRSPSDYGSVTDLYHISERTVPVHRRYTLSVTPPRMDPGLYQKMCLVRLDEEGLPDYVEGEFREGAFLANPREFGTFTLMIDTVAPEIIPLTPAGNNDLTGSRSLRFTVTDDLSGIGRYEGYLDNRWVLFEYDMKNDLLFHTPDQPVPGKKASHELELYVTDEAGNVQLYHQEFKW